MRKSSPFAVLIVLVILALGGGLACALYGTELNTGNTVTWIVTFVAISMPCDKAAYMLFVIRVKP